MSFRVLSFFVSLANHIGMAKSLHYPSIKEYRYWDNDNRCVNVEGMLEDLRVTDLFAVIQLSSVKCCYNDNMCQILPYTEIFCKLYKRHI